VPHFGGYLGFFSGFKTHLHTAPLLRMSTVVSLRSLSFPPMACYVVNFTLRIIGWAVLVMYNFAPV
jgi:hypothetical protein